MEKKRGNFITNKINQFNDFIADKLSLSLSAMVTFYIILALVLLPLLYVQPTSVVAWASYICSVIFQGIALPVLGYTARKASDKSDALINSMYKMTQRIEHLVKIIEKQQEHIDSQVDTIIEIEKKGHGKDEVSK